MVNKKTPKIYVFMKNSALGIIAGIGLWALPPLFLILTNPTLSNDNITTITLGFHLVFYILFFVTLFNKYKLMDDV